MKKTYALFIFTLCTLTSVFAQTDTVREEIKSTEVKIGRNNLWENGRQCIIKSEKEYSKIVSGKSEIDFTKNILIGITNNGSGCQPPRLSHVVFYNPKDSSVTHVLEVTEIGPCEVNHRFEHWCLIERSSKTEKIVLREKRKYENSGMILNSETK